MDWDALRYEHWFATPEGRFALGVERRLLDSMVAEWPRRNQRVLEIGCGTGLFQQILFDDGFSVAGLDKSPEMIAAARRRLGPGAELYVADGRSLPFADNEYDFCVLWTVLEFCMDPAQVLAEAAALGRTLFIAPPPAFDPHWSAHIRQLGQAVRGLCAELGVPTFDLHQPLSVQAGYMASLEVDGIHPDAAGYDSMAALLRGWEPLVQLLGL